MWVVLSHYWKGDHNHQHDRIIIFYSISCHMSYHSFVWYHHFMSYNMVSYHIIFQPRDIWSWLVRWLGDMFGLEREGIRLPFGKTDIHMDNYLQECLERGYVSSQKVLIIWVWMPIKAFKHCRRHLRLIPRLIPYQTEGFLPFNTPSFNTPLNTPLNTLLSVYFRYCWPFNAY